MKPRVDTLTVVTASANPSRAADCIQSWIDRASYQWELIVVANGVSEDAPFLGVVPAFAEGVRMALQTDTAIIVCLHDDLEIKEDGWDATVLAHFELQPRCGLAGFGGGRTIGHPEIYTLPYEPHQLARGSFISNMEEAELHGGRVLVPQKVACLDGFSQIGRRAFWQNRPQGVLPTAGTTPNLFQRLAELGVIHHAYDAALGCYAHRLGYDAWMLPVHCHHYGGVTAVADTKYHDWAKTQILGGDEGFWDKSHLKVYDEFRDVLPFGAMW